MANIGIQNQYLKLSLNDYQILLSVLIIVLKSIYMHATNRIQNKKVDIVILQIDIRFTTVPFKSLSDKYVEDIVIFLALMIIYNYFLKK